VQQRRATAGKLVATKACSRVMHSWHTMHPDVVDAAAPLHAALRFCPAGVTIYAKRVELTYKSAFSLGMGPNKQLQGEQGCRCHSRTRQG
jgi:hypothetical protein